MTNQSSHQEHKDHSTNSNSTQPSNQQLQLLNHFGQQVLDALPLDVVIFEYRAPKEFRLIAGKQNTKLSHLMSAEQTIGKTIRELNNPEDADYVEQLMLQCVHRGESVQIENNFEVAGQRYWMKATYTPMRNEQSEVSHILMTWEDVTEQKVRELEAQKEQLEIIEHQAHQLAELSTPILSISDTTMVMPLVGAIDSNRAQQIFDNLLQGTAQHRASTIIIDITGVPIVDTQVANNLLQASQAVRLLGAEVLITGIRPEVAQTIVGLGINLAGITTRGTLRDGIAYALTNSNPEPVDTKGKTA